MDGTWNGDDGAELTNVWTLYQRVLALHEAGVAEIDEPLYLRGVGTDVRRPFVPSWVKAALLAEPVRAWPKRVVQNVAGGAGGFGTSRRIQQAYAWLVSRYEPGDRICLFGFSRGAFAVRSLAGFVAEVGVLLKHEIAEVPGAYEQYRTGKSLGRVLRRVAGASSGSLRDNALPVHMIGVWDTVDRVGLAAPLQWRERWKTGFHQVEVPDFVSHVRHALALHETRRIFEPRIFAELDDPKRSLEQVWFPGAHADVGGGYGVNQGRLSDIALEWMACEARKLGLPVKADPALPPVLQTMKIHNSVSGKFALARSGVRQFLRDAPTAPADRLRSHRLHRSAVRRLWHVRPRTYPFFRWDVAGHCLEADTLSCVLAVRAACEWANMSAVSPSCEPADRRARRAVPSESFSGREGAGEAPSLAELRDVLLLTTQLREYPAAIVGLRPGRLRRALTLLVVLGEPLRQIDLANAFGRVAAEVLRSTELPAIGRGVAILERWSDEARLAEATLALPGGEVMRSLSTRAGCELALAENSAQAVSSGNLEYVLRERRRKSPLLKL